MNINLVTMRENLSRATEEWQIELGELLNNTTALAVIDYRTQLYTLLLVAIFYAAQNLSFYWNRFFKHQSGTVAIENLQADPKGMIHALLAFVSCGAVFVYAIGGLLGDAALVAKYVSETAEIDILNYPPLDSFITWFRAVLIVMGVYTSIVIRSYRDS